MKGLDGFKTPQVNAIAWYASARGAGRSMYCSDSISGLDLLPCTFYVRHRADGRKKKSV